MPKCFKCNCDLGPVDHGSDPDVIGILYGGTIWRSHGNFGSTLFDATSADDGFLEIVICDKCLEGTKEHVIHVRTVTRTAMETVCDPAASIVQEFVPVTRKWVRRLPVKDFVEL